MSTQEKDADIPGRRRSGTVVSIAALEALGRLSLHTTTTNSRTISVVVEDWLCRMGVLSENARIHTKEDYKALCEAAKQSSKTDGTVEKIV